MSRHVCKTIDEYLLELSHFPPIAPAYILLKLTHFWNVLFFLLNLVIFFTATRKGTRRWACSGRAGSSRASTKVCRTCAWTSAERSPCRLTWPTEALEQVNANVPQAILLGSAQYVLVSSRRSIPHSSHWDYWCCYSADSHMKGIEGDCRSCDSHRQEPRHSLPLLTKKHALVLVHISVIMFKAFLIIIV